MASPRPSPSWTSTDMTHAPAPRTPLSFLLLSSFLVLAAAGCGRPHSKTTDGGPDAGDAGPVNLLCGNGVLDPGEQCDDGNTRYGDGCNQDCQREPGWACTNPGTPCSVAPECGDGFIEEGEECDDGNTANGDGCSSTCTTDPGWTCPQEDQPCVAAACGDGIIAGIEECDDGNAVSNDGCSSTCQVEPGYTCPAPTAPGPNPPCTKTVCGNGTVEPPYEQCDPGDAPTNPDGGIATAATHNVHDLGFGCSATCTFDPQCANGSCVPRCGDGVILPGDTTEQCDDGNTRNGDGCSSTCQIERDWTCTNTVLAPPSSVDLNVVYRDLCGDANDGSSTKCHAGYSHPDFESYSGSGPTTGLVNATLGSDHKPHLTGSCMVGGKTAACPYGQEMTSDAAYFDWYNDNASINRTIVGTINLPRQSDGSYVLDSQLFFPMDVYGIPTSYSVTGPTNSTGVSLVAEGLEPPRGGEDSKNHDFSFTSEVIYWFQYKGTEVLSFTGDDDVWVFINEKLVPGLDLGGLHPASSGTITLSNQASYLGLTVGGIYEATVWQAERHTSGSHYRLTLNNFADTKTTCTSLCGDGIVEADQGEECDDGNRVNGDGCSATCLSEVN